MSKTPFSNKCHVLGGLWLYYRDQANNDEAWKNFFSYNDVGLPLAYILAEQLTGGATAEGREIIEETWKMFCEYIVIDPDEYYTTVADAFEASKQPALNNE